MFKRRWWVRISSQSHIFSTIHFLESCLEPEVKLHLKLNKFPPLRRVRTLTVILKEGFISKTGCHSYVTGSSLAC